MNVCENKILKTGNENKKCAGLKKRDCLQQWDGGGLSATDFFTHIGSENKNRKNLKINVI